MVSIKEGLTAFLDAHKRYNLSGGFGSLANVEEGWPKSLPCSDELEYLYKKNPKGIKVETGLTPLKIFELESLGKGQIGYRWTSTSIGESLELDWPSQYVVIMDDFGGGKPIIADVSTENTAIYASYDVMTPFKISDSLGEFLAALAQLVSIVYGEFDIFEVADDDGMNVKFMERITHEVEPILGKDNFNRFIDYFYG